MLCITIAHGDKWINVLNGKVLGASKHVDYALYHWKCADLKALKVPITKFIYIAADDKVIEVILADQLKARGCNYKTAKRDGAELLDVELAEVSGAIELARGAPQTPKPEPVRPPLDFNPGDLAQVEHTPAEDTPKVILSAEGAANGLGDVLGQADELGSEPEPEGEATEDPPADPLATLKPSRTQNKKKRR